MTRYVIDPQAFASSLVGKRLGNNVKVTCDLDYPHEGHAGRQSVFYKHLQAINGDLGEPQKLAKAPVEHLLSKGRTVSVHCQKEMFSPKHTWGTLCFLQ